MELTLLKPILSQKRKSVIAELKFQTPHGVGLITIGREFFNLVKKIRDSAIWCTINESKPSMFWANILKDASMTMTVSLRDIDLQLLFQQEHSDLYSEFWSGDSFWGYNAHT